MAATATGQNAGRWARLPDATAECTGYAHEVAEMALAHTIENKVERAYRRGDLFDKRRRLMDDWATYCATAKAAGGTVTPIRAAG